MKKKILLLTTGGTIACTKGEAGYAPAMSGELLLSRVPRMVQTLDIEVCPLFNKDSTNVAPEDWTIIADAVFENRDSFDGIVVLHGTDTMAYSASSKQYSSNKPNPRPVNPRNSSATSKMTCFAFIIACACARFASIQ